MGEHRLQVSRVSPSTAKGDFMLYIDKEHSLELQRVLAVMWKDTADDLYEFYDSDYEATMKQVKKKSEEEVAHVINSMWPFVSDKLGYLVETLDHLAY
jgi:hypothetical protein